MDLLDRLLGHDAWTTRLLLERAGELAPEQLDAEFDIGTRTLRATFEHVIYNMEAWTDFLAARPIRPTPEPVANSLAVSGWLDRLDAAEEELAAVSRATQADGRLDAVLVDPTDTPPTATMAGTVIVHVVTHSMHHRAEVLHMLERLGLRDLPEGDAISWERGSGALPESERRRALGLD